MHRQSISFDRCGFDLLASGKTLMNHGLSDFLTQLSAPATAAATTEHLVDFMEAQGAHALHAWFGLDSDSPSVGTYPDWWSEWWWENDFEGHDHVAQHCMQRVEPILFGIDIDSDNPAATPQSLESSRVAWDGFGLRNAIVFPVHSPLGRPAGGLTFGVHTKGDEFRRLLDDIQPVLHVAAMAAHIRIQALFLKERTDGIRLSNRERECLLWLAKGLRTARIAHRLGIREVTVNFYVGKAKKKLGVLTREQAVAKAILLGLITP